ncbi:MAG TPA: energy-coupling factor transporter ATPase, partial [Caldilineaceae bacterium]|nr:energy-coupling factor transporter ATPase [Caldilineaceae bacterium]
MAPIVRVEDLYFSYISASGQPVPALRGVNLAVEPGEYVAILGHNGSGKSTLAKHLNALLLPGAGQVWVKEWNTRDHSRWQEIRATVGMVFQTPDNQIVATIVEEDVAFGPENLGVPRAEMVRRVDWALEQVGMSAHRHRAPHLLSGGQKQRVCIAGVLAMQPQVLVLDEATAMLDPLGRQEVLETVRRLNREQGVTVVAITHFMREAVEADRVVVMAEGQVVMEGSPRALFRQAERLRELHLDVPPVTELALRLHARFPDFPPDLLSVEEVVEAMRRLPAAPPPTAPVTVAPPLSAPPFSARSAAAAPLIDVAHLVHDYMRGTPLAVRAVHDVSLRVYPGEIVGILGHTGSGKSTVVQHFNGLLRPHGGRVTVLGQELSDPKTDVRALRRQVGLLFQFAEAQLFERYVGDDVAFGPRNLGLDREAVRARVRRAMEAVGLGFEEFKDRLTFSLSGGQRRRVALAGVLALEPQVLVLDEPTAGLDPEGHRLLLDQLLALHRQGITLVIISHNMEEL